MNSRRNKNEIDYEEMVVVVYNRVIRLPAHIFCNNDREFIGAALGIPPLRDKINSISGKLTRQDVILLAEELYMEYQNRYKNEKEKWYDIKNNHYDIHSKTQSHRGNLRKFINKYKEE